MPNTASEQPEYLGALEVDAALVEDIAHLLEEQQRGMVLNLVADLHPADLALLLTHLSSEDARQLLIWLPEEKAGDILPELDSTYRASLLDQMQLGKVSALVDELESDDAADVVGELPDELAEQVLPLLEDEEDVRELLEYDEDSAGGLMGREYMAAQKHWTIAEVTEEVRRLAEEVEQVHVVYVLDADEHLVGFMTLKALLLAPAHAVIGDLMREEFVSVPTSLDQEEVARIMERYDLIALPVVDFDGRLVGRITIDDVVDVIREEAEEDMQLMSGVTGGEEPTDSVLRITRGRLPWLLVGLLGAGLSGLVIGTFEMALKQAAVLAAFIPIMMATAGNVGIQCSAIIVQGLASGDLWTTDLFSRLMKEMAVSMINAVALAVVLAGIILVLPSLSDKIGAFIEDPVMLALTAGLSLMAVIILSTVIGTAVPLLLDRVEIDHAIATGPFITTSNDIIGLTVYFWIATLLYL